jgi:hypothetical protein
LVEHRLAAHLELLPRAVDVDAAEDEIEERLPGGDGLLQQVALRLVPARHLRAAFSIRPQTVHPDAEHLQHRAGNLGEAAVRVLLPVPVGGELGEAAIARFALAQLGGPFAHLLLELRVVALELLVEQPHLQHVVDAGPDFDQVERLGHEVLRAGLQRAQLVAGLRGDHQDRQVAVGVVRLEGFDHLEAVHARHLQVEQDQVVAVLAMQRAHLVRIHGRGDRGVAGFLQHLREQADVGLLIVDDQEAGVENVGGREPHACSFSVCENFSATSSASMNWLTLMGLVR